MAAPPGNQNAAKGKKWLQAITRALEKRSKAQQTEALDDLAEKLLMACDNLDISALKELGDRLDGKVTQMIEGPGDDGSHRFILIAPWMNKAVAERNG